MTCQMSVKWYTNFNLWPRRRLDTIIVTGRQGVQQPTEPPPLLPILKPPPASAYRTHHTLTPSFFSSLANGAPLSPPQPGVPTGGLFSWARMRSGSFGPRRQGSFMVTASSAAAIAGVKTTSIAPAIATVTEVESTDRTRAATEPVIASTPQLSIAVNTDNNGTPIMIDQSTSNDMMVVGSDRRPSAKSDPTSSTTHQSRTSSATNTILILSSMEVAHNNSQSPPQHFHKMVTSTSNNSLPQSAFQQMTRSRPGSVVKDKDGTSSKRGSIVGIMPSSVAITTTNVSSVVSGPTVTNSGPGVLVKGGSMKSTSSGAAAMFPIKGRVTEVIIMAPKPLVTPLSVMITPPPVIAPPSLVASYRMPSSLSASIVDYGHRDYGHRRVPSTTPRVSTLSSTLSPPSPRMIQSGITQGPAGGHALDWSPTHGLPSINSKFFPPSPCHQSSPAVPSSPVARSYQRLHVVTDNINGGNGDALTPGSLLTLTPMAAPSPYALASPAAAAHDMITMSSSTQTTVVPPPANPAVATPVVVITSSSPSATSPPGGGLVRARPIFESPRILAPFPLSSSSSSSSSTLLYSRGSSSSLTSFPMSSSSSSSSSYSIIEPAGWEPSSSVRVPTSLWLPPDTIDRERRAHMRAPPSSSSSRSTSDWREQRRAKGDI
jgi:hypothetical protein